MNRPTLALIALIPFVFVLGVLARPYLPRHTEPPTVSPRAAEFAGLGGTFDLVLLGDSLTDRGRWHELTGLNVANRGIGRDTVSMAANRLDQSVSETHGPVFILLGINDLIEGHPIERIVADYRTILQGLSGRRVVVQSVVGPAEYPVQELNAALRDLAASEGVEWLDLTDALGAPLKHTIDGVHLSGEGYRIWANWLVAAI